MRRPFLLFCAGLTASTLANAQVYYGTDDAGASDNFRLDIATGVSAGPVWTGGRAWGLADDDVNQVMYVIDGALLKAWPYGSANAATTIGTMTYLGATKSMVSGAHHNGVLYGNPNISIEGFYSIDVVTATLTLLHTFSSSAIDLGGLDFDPATALLYGSNDSATYTDPQGTVGRGIIVFDLFAPTITEVNTYPYPTSPAGTQLNDIDGLAFDPSGVIYMLEDNPAPLHRYIISLGAYDPAPPMNAIAGSEVFSGGTYSPVAPGAKIGTSYCGPAVVNSSGNSAVISARGSASVAANDLELYAVGLPVNSFAFFIASMTQDLVPMAGGGQGTLCLGGSIGRGVGGAILNSGALGTVSIDADLNAMPTPTGPVAVLAGETWHLQCWFRDSVGGNATSNLSDAVSVTFN